MAIDIFVSSVNFLHIPQSVEDDNIDAVIRLSDGSAFTATFFTLKNITSLLLNYENTGECLFGKYFWAKDMIIVQDLREETLMGIIHDLVTSGDYVHALQRSVTRP